MVTRLATDLMPLDWILSRSTWRAWVTVVRSESNMMVPWCMTRPSRTYWELPENFLPSTVMSLRPEISACTPKERSVSTMGTQNIWRSMPSILSASVMNVKFRLPRS